MPAVRLLVDENIPLAEEAFRGLGRVRLAPGWAIDRKAVREADALLVRSVTRIDEALLKGSPVSFVGSATIGTDHVDQAYLREAGIAFAHAPGSNAGSVVEYVIAALLALSVARGEALRGKTVGIVGCGNIGSRLRARLPALGMNVLASDPPLAVQAEAEHRAHAFLPLEALLAAADVVTLHVPLEKSGPFPTRHLMNARTLAGMKPGAWLLNTCRGSVVSGAALLEALAGGRVGAAVLDVWEGEPNPSPDLHARVDLGTPHIAGYSYDGKAMGTVMLYDALTRFLGVDGGWPAEAALALAPEDWIDLAVPDVLPDGGAGEVPWLDALVRRLYDLRADDARMRPLLALPEAERGAFFNGLRRDYPRRRAFERYTLPERAVPPALREAVAQGLRVGLAP